MKKRFVWILLLCLALTACGAKPAASTPAAPAPSVSAPVSEPEPALSPAPAPEPEPEPDAARALLDRMTLEQKVAQLFFVRCPESGGEELAASDQCPGGFLLFGADFAGRTADEAANRIAALQASAQTPLLIGVDEEGGTVVRVSRYFRDAPFSSPQKLYREGGLDAILADTIEKDGFLQDFGINVNLAPVADLSDNPADFIYPRALGEDAETTADYVAAVARQMTADGMGCVLKHFPGYGSNADTHTGSAYDLRALETFETADLLPFAAGIKAGAPAVLVSHNVVPAFGDELPASLSPCAVGYLRDTMDFEGVILTDDLSMAAASGYPDAAVRAVQAGCDLLITSRFADDCAAVQNAVELSMLSEEQIDASAYRVLRWKAALGLLPQS